jgi:asparagine synthetase B (glutamine-hydrolysing)
MCGIFSAVSRTAAQAPSEQVLELLKHRGPDHLGEHLTAYEAHESKISLRFVSTVLALRGDHVASQPLVDATSGSSLSWNGEAWKISGKPVEGNDGEAILKLLCEAASNSSSEDAVTKTLGVLRSISGPFAFVYFDKAHGLLYYGRDRLGRRSLLVDVERASGSFYISSVADSTLGNWREVEADGIYVLALDERSQAVLPKSSDDTAMECPFPCSRVSWTKDEESEHAVS